MRGFWALMCQSALQSDTPNELVSPDLVHCHRNPGRLGKWLVRGIFRWHQFRGTKSIQILTRLLIHEMGKPSEQGSQCWLLDAVCKHGEGNNGAGLVVL